MSDEDALDDTIRPRLDAAGADCTKIHGMKMVQELTDDGQVLNRGFSLATDVQRLEERIDEIGDVALVEIDPISAYLGGTDSHKNSDVRALLSPLKDLAEKLNVAIVLVTHLNKGSGAAIYRSIGSIAFAGAARSSWIVAKDKNDPLRRLFMPAKNNLGNDQSGMAYRVETATNQAPVIIWEPVPVNLDVDEVLNWESEDFRTERDEAKDWLESELCNGPVPTKELQRKARDAGHSWSTVKRAKKDLGAEARKCGFNRGAWVWYHPDDLPVKNEGDHEEVEEDQSKSVGPFGNSWSSSGDISW